MEQDRNPPAKFANTFSNRLEFVLTLLGFSLGLADIWRLPYLVYRNGGGAFLLPYLFCMVIIGVPLYFGEIAIGQFSGKGGWRVWDICPLLRGFGVAFLIINFLPAVYVSIIRAWVIQYLISSFSSELPWTVCGQPWNSDNCIGLADELASKNKSANNITEVLVQNATASNASDLKQVSSVEEFWVNKVLDASSGIENMGEINGYYILYLFIAQIVIFFALIKSVKSLGKFVYVTVLGPIIIILIIFIRALTLPGSAEGVLYFLKPDFRTLGKMEVWVEAAFMAFYTLGPGWGGLIVFGAHNKFHDKCLRDSLIAVMSTLFFGLFNGLTVFSVIGVMAEETGVPIPNVLSSGGFSLGFVAYPKAVTFFPFPQLWAVLFFLVLLLPSMDYEAGVYLFQFFDWYSAPWFLTLASLIEAVVLAWTYGGDRLSRDISFMLGIQMPHILRVSLAFITPPFLLIMLVISIKTYKPPIFGTYQYPEGAIVFGWILSVSAFVPVIIWSIMYIWKKHKTESILQRFITGLQPDKWEPVDPEYKTLFYIQEKNRDRSLRKTFIFNLTGRGGFDEDTIIEQKDDIINLKDGQFS